MTQPGDAYVPLNAECINSLRQSLLYELADYTRRSDFGQQDISSQLFDAELTALLWFCDPKRLLDYAQTLRSAASTCRGTIIFGLAMRSRLGAAVKKWNQAMRSSKASRPKLSVNSQPMSGGPLMRGLRDLAVKTCLDRDYRQCVLTNATDAVKVVHIIPLALQGELDDLTHKTNNYPASFFNTLRLFWRNETVEHWLAPLKHGLDCCGNTITLSSLAGSYYHRGYFALKPEHMSGDRTELTVRFFWLPPPSRVKPPTLTTPPDIPGTSMLGYGDADDLATLCDVETGAQLRSGQKIVLRTADPDVEPLPLFELLRLRWLFQRIALLMAAGEYDVVEDEKRRADPDAAEWVEVRDESSPSVASLQSFPSEDMSFNP